MKIVFYEMTSDTKKVDKFVHKALSINNARIKEPCNILNPILLIHNNEVLKKNYFWCEYLNRWYYITDFKFLENGLIEVYGKVDVLKTYAEDIKKREAFVLRQENKYNVNFSDSLLPIRTDTNYKVYDFGNVFDEYFYYVTTNGGVF